jgi:2-polyprenyl-6-hydroxyphenyl methylase/3-demethylubiquinone-9 3-methyltransferase
MATSADPLFDCAGWWDPADRAFASLRAVSAFRLTLIDAWLGADWRGRVVVDLGCGGGLLAVPLAQRGARVLGVDVARTALHAARRQAAPRLLTAAGDLCAPPVGDGVADVVLLADVVEHVAEPARAVAAAARLLRPGGRLFVNTIARTLRSRLFAIWLAEGLGYVPRGTHRHDWFVPPAELVRMAADAGLREVARVGEAPRLLATVRSGAVQLRASKSMAVGYAMLFGKEAA